ncbi:MAG: transporter substrate-binding domain-containing protein, partial [Gammaproteobacteria bacterium]|nr:transporter substrate-binding domain-containing protein [Gammaproteobacteria bacterium]
LQKEHVVIKLVSIFALMLVFTILPNGHVYGDEKSIILTTGIGEPLHYKGDKNGFIEAIIEEAFKRVGVVGIVSRKSSKLSLINANTGADDGLAMRIKGLDKKYKNLIRVPEVIMCSEFSGYSKTELKPINNWDDMTDIYVAYVNGWRIFENNVINNNRVIKADSADLLFGMLEKDRTEIVLYEKWQGLSLIEKLGIKAIKVNRLPLEQKKMYVYLHKKHKHLVSGVAKAMRDMKSDGTYQRIFDQSMAQYINGANKNYSRHIMDGCH